VTIHEKAESIAMPIPQPFEESLILYGSWPTLCGNFQVGYIATFRA
jgi:hypothetical protein